MAYTEFQNTVNKYYAVGQPGQPVNINSLVTTAFNYVSDGTVEAGSFAFEAATPDSDTAVNFVSKTKAGGRLIGLVVRVLNSSLNVPFTGHSSTYQKGAALTIARRGQLLALVPSGQTPTQGQAVLCDPATGNVTYGESGAANDTGWRVILLPGQSTAAEGDLVIYENLGAEPTASE